MFYVVKSMSRFCTIILQIYVYIYYYQGSDFEDMSSFFPCEIDDANQYINLGYGPQVPKIIRNVLTRRREYGTYLATARRHRRRIKMQKRDE